MYMHITTQRLYEAAKRLKNSVGQTSLANLLNESPQTINNWEARGMSKAGMIKAQELIGCSVVWLKTGEGRMVGEPISQHNDLDMRSPDFRMSTSQLNYSRIPLVSWVAAGHFCENNDYLADDHVYIESTYRARERTFALVVNGPSMLPKFPEGSTIIVEPDAMALNGSYVIVRQNSDSEATFKQLVIEGDTKYLKALNPDWPNRIIQMRDDAIICGVVKRIEMDV